MTPEQTCVAYGPYHALIRDIVACFPELHSSLESDLHAINKRVLTRGESLVTIHLPNLGKIYDKGLSSGILSYDRIPKELGSWEKKTLIFRVLLSYSFNDQGVLIDPNPEIVFFTRSLLYLCKKVEGECGAEAMYSAIDKFVGIEYELRDPSKDWSSNDVSSFHQKGVNHSLNFGDDYLAEFKNTPEFCNETHKALQTLDWVCRNLTPHKELNPYDIVPKHGPGAVSDIRSGEDKYSMKWNTRLSQIFDPEYFLVPRGFQYPQEEIFPWDSFPHSRLIAVPKDLSGPRLIASEPAAHQFIQQGLMKWLRENLSPTLQKCVDFLSQEPSRELTLEASRTGELVTVDLSSASDRLSCWTVERAFKHNVSLLEALWSSRTNTIDLDAIEKKIADDFKLPIRDWYHEGCTKSRMILNMRKFACQGSAVTFPVQTIIYACVSIAALIRADGLKPTPKNMGKAAGQVRVFGDDIIVPKRALFHLGLILEHLQLKVNVTKTHHEGHFRESCGMDAWKGYDVTPLYLSHFMRGRKAQEIASWIDVSNNAYSKGLFSLAMWMDRQIPSRMKVRLYTGMRETPGLRLLCFTGETLPRETRYNEDLQREEYKVLMIKTFTERGSRENEFNLLQWFLENPPQDIVWQAGWTRKSRTHLKVGWAAL
nr:MAG: RNA dependent RNA polymerase [Leviviridae sp.]